MCTCCVYLVYVRLHVRVSCVMCCVCEHMPLVRACCVWVVSVFCSVYLL